MEPRLVFTFTITLLITVGIVPTHLTTAAPDEEDDNIIDTSSKLNENEEIPDDAESENSAVRNGWSPWSQWSACSRSCNGGVTYQLRKCQEKSGCKGEAANYRICNMQPCPDSEDFRASQCSAFNMVAYRGRMYEWLPYQDPEDACGLTCHAKGYSFVAKLAPIVRDGTRCREGSLDMCVEGKCRAVGCDLQLGSRKKVDECGVCGGDGSTCKIPVYVWGKTPFSPCSVSCGGGYQMSRPTCLNKVNDKEVDERLCDVTLRPRPQIKECSTLQCPPVWVTDSWSPCSATCGGGRQSRQVHCAQMGTDGVRARLAKHMCQRQKPVTERQCNLMPCPKWTTGRWSGCSVTCGKGHKSRSVACQDSKGHHSEDCDVENMPPTKQDCDSELICTPSEDPGSYLFSDIFRGSQEDAPPPSSYQSLPWKQKPSPVSTEPSYVSGEWGSCSVTCGQGIRKRKVECNIFLEFSRTVAKLPDKECPGPRPPDIENCFPRPCSLDHQNKAVEDRKHSKGYMGIEVTYSWKVNGFTACSASCLGGIRESVIQCVRDHDQAVVMASQCDLNQKPDAITQTCNDHPCPPKWNVSDFTACSKSCGGGIQTRLVQCIHEVTRGAANTLVVANDLCPQPPQRVKQFCNVFDCPAQWKTEDWSKCSKKCGGGVKTRKLRCMREQSFGQVVELAPSRCSKRRPKIQKPCNTKPCGRPDYPAGPEIYPSHQTYVQEGPQRRVFLKVGGTAIVFAGTNLKIRCPGRKTNKTNIMWYKNDEKITSSRRIKVSMKGALRVRKIAYKDGGKYTCVSGHSKADLHITIKPLPVGTTSDEDKTVQRPTDVRPMPKGTEEIFSHEKFQPPTNSGERDKNYKNDVNRNKIYNPSKSHEHQNGDTESTEAQNKYSYGHKTYGEGSAKSHGNKDDFDFSTLERVPLYVLAGQSTEKPRTTSTETVRNPNLDSEEPLQHRGPDRNKNRPKTYPDGNDVLNPPYPRVIDTWEERQRYDGSRRKPTPKPYDTWEKNHGGALFSDQESGDLSIGTPHNGKGFPGLNNEQPASSGASSNHAGSHIQQLLVNLHNTLGGSKGKSSTTNVHDTVDDMNASDEAEDETLTNPSRFVSNSFVLGKGRAENLEFAWVIGDWSTCSQACGGAGFQVRASQCMVKLNNVSKTVDGSLCDDAGLKSPETFKNCGSEDCPHWESSPWTQCLESQCFTWHSSYQKRNIHCRSSNGTDLPLSQCDERTRPRRKRECYNERCRSSWKVGEWSECTASCSRQGFQSRILQCVWFGSNKPAGNACRDQPRPTVYRPCIGPPCESRDDCTDRSSYCSLAKALHLCRLSNYHLQCCDSCRKLKA